MVEVDSKEISQYMKSVLKGIEGGLSAGYFVSSGVSFDIGLKNISTKNGGVRITVVGIGGETKKESDARVSFEVMNPLALAEKAEATKYAEDLVEGGDMSKALGLKPSKPRKDVS